MCVECLKNKLHVKKSNALTNAVQWKETTHSKVCKTNMDTQDDNVWFNVTLVQYISMCAYHEKNILIYIASLAF